MVMERGLPQEESSLQISSVSELQADCLRKGVKGIEETKLFVSDPPQQKLAGNAYGCFFLSAARLLKKSGPSRDPEGC